MLRWIRGAFLENLNLKLFSFILAFILFRFIKADQARNQVVEVKVLFKYPSKLIMVSNPITKLKVTIRGPESQLRGVDSKPLRYTLNLINATAGSSRIELYTDQLSKIFPENVHVIRISPYILDFFFEKMTKKVLPIKIYTKGRPRLGYQLVRPVQFSPREITVIGARSSVSELKFIEAEPVDISGRKEDFTTTLLLEKPGKTVRFLGVKDKKSRVVKATVRFRKLMVRKGLKKVALRKVDFISLKVNHSINIEEINVVLYGPLAALRTLKKKDLIVEVNGRAVAGKPPGAHTVKLRYRLPPEIVLLKGPKTVVITTTFLPKENESSEPLDEADAGEPEPSKTRKSPVKRRKRRRRRRRRRRKRRVTPRKRAVKKGTRTVLKAKQPSLRRKKLLKTKTKAKLLKTKTKTKSRLKKNRGNVPVKRRILRGKVGVLELTGRKIAKHLFKLKRQSPKKRKSVSRKPPVRPTKRRLKGHTLLRKMQRKKKLQEKRKKTYLAIAPPPLRSLPPSRNVKAKVERQAVGVLPPKRNYKWAQSTSNVGSGGGLLGIVTRRYQERIKQEAKRKIKSEKKKEASKRKSAEREKNPLGQVEEAVVYWKAQEAYELLPLFSLSRILFERFGQADLWLGSDKNHCSTAFCSGKTKFAKEPIKR